MRTAVVAVLLLALLVAMAAPTLAASVDVTIRAIGPDNTALANAKVVLYDIQGNAYEGTTNSTGYVTITVPAPDVYLVVVEGGKFYILDTVNTSATTLYTVNATLMHHANLSSTPTVVDVKVALAGFGYNVSLTTNTTVYAASDLEVFYPAEVVKFPYKYTFEKIKYDNTETTNTSVTLVMTADYDVVAYYTKQFYLTLELWVAIILVACIVIAILAAMAAGARAAKSVLHEYSEKKRKFVRRK